MTCKDFLEKFLQLYNCSGQSSYQIDKDNVLTEIDLHLKTFHKRYKTLSTFLHIKCRALQLK